MGVLAPARAVQHLQATRTAFRKPSAPAMRDHCSYLCLPWQRLQVAMVKSFGVQNFAGEVKKMVMSFCDMHTEHLERLGDVPKPLQVATDRKLIARECLSLQENDVTIPHQCAATCSPDSRCAYSCLAMARTVSNDTPLAPDVSVVALLLASACTTPTPFVVVTGMCITSTVSRKEFICNNLEMIPLSSDMSCVPRL